MCQCFFFIFCSSKRRCLTACFFYGAVTTALVLWGMCPLTPVWWSYSSVPLSLSPSSLRICAVCWHNRRNCAYPTTKMCTSNRVCCTTNQYQWSVYGPHSFRLFIPPNLVQPRDASTRWTRRASCLCQRLVRNFCLKLSLRKFKIWIHEFFLFILWCFWLLFFWCFEFFSHFYAFRFNHRLETKD